MVSAAKRRGNKNLQLHNPLFLRQFLLKSAGDALAPLAEVATAALKLLQLCVKLRLLGQHLVQLGFDLRFRYLNLRGREQEHKAESSVVFFTSFMRAI